MNQTSSINGSAVRTLLALIVLCYAGVLILIGSPIVLESFESISLGIGLALALSFCVLIVPLLSISIRELFRISSAGNGSIWLGVLLLLGQAARLYQHLQRTGYSLTDILKNTVSQSVILSELLLVTLGILLMYLGTSGNGRPFYKNNSTTLDSNETEQTEFFTTASTTDQPTSRKSSKSGTTFFINTVFILVVIGALAALSIKYGEKRNTLEEESILIKPSESKLTRAPGKNTVLTNPLVLTDEKSSFSKLTPIWLRQLDRATIEKSWEKYSGEMYDLSTICTLFILVSPNYDVRDVKVDTCRGYGLDLVDKNVLFSDFESLIFALSPLNQFAKYKSISSADFQYGIRFVLTIRMDDLLDI